MSSGVVLFLCRIVIRVEVSKITSMSLTSRRASVVVYKYLNLQ